MRTLGLLLVVLGIASLPGNAQETDAPEGAIIDSAEVSGIRLEQLSPGLREDIRALTGTTLDRGKAEALATRIEEEQPEVVAAVRVIAATHRRLEQMVAESTFRQDLFYRLNVVPVRVSALRERPEDIRDLAAYFLSDFCARNNFRTKTIDDDVLTVLEQYRWPGNVRELRNAVERMAILTTGDRITLDSVPVEIRTPASPAAMGLHGIRNAAERERIVQALEQTSWNVSGAARLLGVERTNLHKRIRALGLSRE